MWKNYAFISPSQLAPEQEEQHELWTQEGREEEELHDDEQEEDFEVGGGEEKERSGGVPEKTRTPLLGSGEKRQHRKRGRPSNSVAETACSGKQATVQGTTQL